jgi:hypothetical protein
MVPILQSWLSFFIPISMFKGFSSCISAVNILYFDQFYPIFTFLYLLFPISHQLSIYIIRSSTELDVMYLNNAGSLLFFLMYDVWCCSYITLLVVMTEFKIGNFI